jgi:hypothetical protein
MALFRGASLVALTGAMVSAVSVARAQDGPTQTLSDPVSTAEPLAGDEILVTARSAARAAEHHQPCRPIQGVAGVEGR